MTKIATILCLLICTSLTSFAQFEGVLTYDIAYTSSDKEMVGYLESFPKQSSLFINNERMRFDQNLSGGGKQSFISNTETNTTSLLMNFMGGEFQVNLTAEQISQLELAQQLKIVKTEKTKSIAGYLCQHAYAISGSDSLSIYYTTEIKTGCIVPQFADLDGLPLYYEMNRGKIQMAYTCKEVSQEKVELNRFVISRSIREIPFEDFARSFAQMK